MPRRALLLLLLVAFADVNAPQQALPRPQPPRPGTGLIPTIHDLMRDTYPASRPGAVALAARDGRPVFRRAYGLADAEFGIMLEPDMMFRIGSVTKQFTAGVTLRLAEQEKLSLTAPVSTYLPGLPEAWAAITLEHVLSHTSGLTNYTALPGYATGMGEDLPVGALIQRFSDLPLEFAPGTKWKYSNSGYALAGAVIEKVTGRAFRDVLHDDLLSPLGLHRTIYDSPTRLVPRRVRGYVQRGDELLNAPYVSITQPYAAGALASTLDDLLAWDNALSDGRALGRGSLARMFAPVRLSDGSESDYGLGWTLSSYEGRLVAEHGGAINGFACHVVRVPDERVYVAVLSNVQRPDANPHRLARRIAALMLGAPTEGPELLSQPVSVLDQYAGQYVMPDGEVMTLTRDGSSLVAATRGGRATFDPVAKDEFVERRGVFQLVFRRDAAGRVEGFRRSGWGKPEDAQRQP